MNPHICAGDYRGGTENNMNKNEQKLAENSYPGRGIVIGMTPDGQNLVQIYWIMGRSENSRNRIFLQEGDSVKTKAHIESAMSDPSLIIYYPVKVCGNQHIVTNGDQTDTIETFLSEGKTFEQALLTRCFEPDPPNFTPRISGVIDYSGAESTFKLSILKTVGNDENAEKKEFYNFNTFTPGKGLCIHTYLGDGAPLPSFDALPYELEILDGIEENAEKFWSMLNSENRVSLLVKYIDVSTGHSNIKIINRFE